MASNEKLFNMKVVQNFEIFNFCFRHFFIWTMVWKIKFETYVHFKKCPIQRRIKGFLKFRAKTWNLAKMKVEEEEKFHNIDVGQKLIRVLDLGENRGQS